MTSGTCGANFHADKLSELSETREIEELLIKISCQSISSDINYVLRM